MALITITCMFPVLFNEILFISIFFEDYVEEIYQTYVTANKEKQLPNELKSLIAMQPKPTNSMLQKKDRAEAIQKREQRKKLAMEAKDVPPTTPCNTLLLLCTNHLV